MAKIVEMVQGVLMVEIEMVEWMTWLRLAEMAKMG
jgi:hypothetical protein